MTQAAQLLPPVPTPPHDPKAIVLDWRAGWRASGPMIDLERSPLDGALALVPAAGGAPLATVSFGGLVLPDNVALTADGMLYVLDRASVRLLRFDPCTCAFAPVACIAGQGTRPRELTSPGAIVASCGNLYVCDAGNRRVQVFGLRGLPLRAIWKAPAGLAQPWLPVAAAADARARIYIGDRDNGMIHVYAATSGRFLRSLAGLGAITHLAVDADGRIYVQVEGIDEVRIIDADGAQLEVATRADDVATRFAPLPFPVAPDGQLTLCDQTYTADGTPVPPETVVPPAYATDGTLTTVALDSGVYRCVWDRLEIDGDFPDGTTVIASVYTSETDIPVALIASDAWVACPPCDGLAQPWDCMLRAPAGRFLWLRLAFASHGDATPRVRRARIQFPRISLRRYLPRVFGADAQAAELTDRFLAVFGRTLTGIEATIDNQARYFDPSAAPTEFLTWLGTWIGVTLDRSWPEARRRRYLAQVAKLYPRRGTLDGFREQLRLYLGLPAQQRAPALVLEHYRLRRWLFLGAGRLGDAARLWGDNIVNRSRLDGPHCRGNAQLGVTELNTTQDPLRDPFWVYAHRMTVFAPASCARSPSAKRGLERLVRAERPAHVAFQIVYVEPRFRIGVQSMIGFDTAIGRYPDANIALGEARLGRATVLGGERSPTTRLR